MSASRHFELQKVLSVADLHVLSNRVGLHSLPLDEQLQVGSTLGGGVSMNCLFLTKVQFSLTLFIVCILRDPKVKLLAQ